MAHHGLNLFRRTAAKQIVVKGDAHGVSKAAYVGTHTGGLPGSIDLKNIACGNSVGACQTQDRLGNLGIIQTGNLVEYGNNVDRRDEDNDDKEPQRDDGAPNPPRTLKATHDTEKDHGQDCTEDEIHQQALELVSHPGSKCLSSETVFMFAEIVFINRKREAQNCCEQKILRPVDDGMHWLETCNLLGEISHCCG